MLKEIFYTGLGGAVLLKERVYAELSKMEEKGKITKEDAKEFIETLKTKGEEEESKHREEIKRLIKEVIDEMGIATKADIESLKESKESK